MIDHKVGDPMAKVCYLDYGDVDDVPVKNIRKMLPEFVRNEPALAVHVDVSGERT
jgi:hypothetical protein